MGKSAPFSWKRLYDKYFVLINWNCFYIKLWNLNVEVTGCPQDEGFVMSTATFMKGLLSELTGPYRPGIGDEGCCSEESIVFETVSARNMLCKHISSVMADPFFECILKFLLWPYEICAIIKDEFDSWITTSNEVLRVIYENSSFKIMRNPISCLALNMCKNKHTPMQVRIIHRQHGSVQLWTW